MSPPWMPFYIADYLADTRRLSTMEHGAYLLLIMEYWQHGGLPNDDCQLARITLTTEKDWKRIRSTMERFFSPGWKHGRIDDELSKAKAKSAARADAGARGGKAKGKQNGSKEEAIASSLPEQNETLAQASSSQPHSLRSDSDLGATARDLNSIEHECRVAGAHLESPSPGFMDLSPIIGLLDGGADLNDDVLPGLRSRPNPKARSWAYYVPQIQDYRARRLGAAQSTANLKPQSRAPPPKQPSINDQAYAKLFGNRNERPYTDPNTIDGDFTVSPAGS